MLLIKVNNSTLFFTVIVFIMRVRVRGTSATQIYKKKMHSSKSTTTIQAAVTEIEPKKQI